MSEITDYEHELVTVAMQIILHAGDARIKISEALAKAKGFEFQDASLCMREAEQAITLAHKSQTEVIQNEASGKTYEPSLLFTHAQDTLMTIHSELRMAKEMIDILQIIANK